MTVRAAARTGVSTFALVAGGAALLFFLFRKRIPVPVLLNKAPTDQPVVWLVESEKS